MADGQAAAVDVEAAPPSAWEIFLAFSRVGLTSFGGGLSGWMMREFVQRRRWIDEGEFLSGLALAQALPGVNVVNLSIWIGFRLRGGLGALMGALGMIVPPMLLAVSLVALSGQLLHGPLAYRLLAGVAAAALGLSLQMGLRAARRAANGVVPVVIMAITFLAIFHAGLPLVWVVAAMAPLSIAWSAWRLRRGA